MCRFALDAPAGAVFTVPETVMVGDAVVHVHFADDVLRDFGARGVILIDANYEPPLKTSEEGSPTNEIDLEADAKIPIACNEQEAKTKGLARWKEYIDKNVRAYLDQCEQIRSAGGVPIAASGWIKRALNLAGITDPAEAMLIESKKQTSVIEKLQQIIEEQAANSKRQQEQIDELLRRDANRTMQEGDAITAGKQKGR